MSCHRFIGVCFPLRANRILTKRSVNIYLTVVIIVWATLALPIGFWVTIEMFLLTIQASLAMKNWVILRNLLGSFSVHLLTDLLRTFFSGTYEEPNNLERLVRAKKRP